MTVRTPTKVGLALGGVALVAALVPGAMASGSDPPTSQALTGDVLLLHMGQGGDYFQVRPGTGSSTPSATQTITTKSCVVTLNPNASLVTLRPTPAPPNGAVGLFDHSLGVKAKGDGTGTPCGRVDGTSQALTLGLVGSSGTTLAGKLIETAELDIEGKFGVTVRGRALRKGQEIWTGSLPTGPDSDSGPDSVDGDNFRWLIDPPGPFDELVLSVDPSTPGGSFSLEGGADGTDPGPLGARLHTSDSVFQLTEITGVIDCGETAPPVGGGSTPEATLSRGQNPSCTPLPYLLRTDPDNSVLLQKDASSQPGANFFLDIVWEPEDAVLPVPATTIDYDGDGPNPPQTVQWCLGTSANPVLPADQKWCLANQSTELVSDTQMQVSERYYGAGDPRWAR